MDDQVKINVRTSIDIVYEQKVHDYDENEIKKFSYSKYEIVRVTRLNEGEENII